MPLSFTLHLTFWLPLLCLFFAGDSLEKNKDKPVNPLHRKGFPICPYYAIMAHLRDSGPPERCGGENSQQYAATTTQASLSAPTPTPPGSSRTERQKRWEILWPRSCNPTAKSTKKPGRKAKVPVWHSVPFRTFRRVDHSAGQRKLVKINSPQKL